MARIRSGFCPKGAGFISPSPIDILFIFLFIELGVLLTITPWTGYWENNLFLFQLEDYFGGAAVRSSANSGYVRGAVTGVGLTNLAAGLNEVLCLLAVRRRAAFRSGAGPTK